MCRLLLASYRDDELRADHPLRGVLGELVRSRSVRRTSLDLLCRPRSRVRPSRMRWTPGALRSDRRQPVLHHRGARGGKGEIADGPRRGPGTRQPPADSGSKTCSTRRRSALSRPSCGCWSSSRRARSTRSTRMSRLRSLERRRRGCRIPPRARAACIEEAISTRRRAKLHREALEALSERDTSDLARLAHHADAARDEDAVRRYAPAATRGGRPRSARIARPPHGRARSALCGRAAAERRARCSTGRPRSAGRVGGRLRTPSSFVAVRRRSTPRRGTGSAREILCARWCGPRLGSSENGGGGSGRSGGHRRARGGRGRMRTGTHSPRWHCLARRAETAGRRCVGAPRNRARGAARQDPAEFAEAVVHMGAVS